MTVPFIYDWEKNEFWKDINKSIRRGQEGILSGIPCTYDEQAGVWQQACSAGRSVLPSFLQNKFTVADVTDRGLGIYPILLNGRYFLRVAFRINTGGETFCTHDLSDVDGAADAITNRQLSYGPGWATLAGCTPKGLRCEVRTYLPKSFPLVVMEVSVIGGSPEGLLEIKPEIVWMPGDAPIQAQPGFLWLKPQEASLPDEYFSRNDSAPTDPLRSAKIKPAGLAVALAAPGVQTSGFQRASLAGKDSLLLADRRFTGNELERINLPRVQVRAAGGRARFTLVVGVCETPAEFSMLYEAWLSKSAGGYLPEEDYWAGVQQKLSFNFPDKAIQRQGRYSLHNSLFSRSVSSGGRTLFIHGRRDRGYADCAKIHQTYQLHFAALAAGETSSVRQELLSFSAVQDKNGGIQRQLSPRSGWHPYVGTYNNANYLLAIYRYLCWSGDIAFLDEKVDSLVEPGDRQPVLEHALRAAEWLLENRWHGVIAPCGWVDAWPAGVKANSQASMAACMAFNRLAQICEYQRREKEAYDLYRAAQELEKSTRELFFNLQNGLYSEYLFEDGSTEGGKDSDFYSITQFWAVLAGMAQDQRGMDLTRETCLKRGMVMNPETVADTAYLTQFQDDYNRLPVDRNITWALATWPELTHLYALAEIKLGRPDLALDAVLRQLPESIHAENPYAAPFYYPEKYIPPLTVPWLCTWAGDPTLIEVLLEGFFGVQPDLRNLQVNPHLPVAWKGAGKVSTRFCWRGAQYELVVDPAAPAPDNAKLREIK
jgi:hypothetical protein